MCSRMTLPLTIFRALADPTRLRIVSLLRAMELSVGELAQVLGQSQPRVSRHVKILCDAGIAERRKEGSWVFLVPGAPARVKPIFAAIDAWDDDNHWAVADTARLTAVRADRARAAERYFAAQAEHWDAMRSLHVAEDVVETALADVIGAGPLGRLVDIGTGTGRMLALFASRASHAIGIDRSPEMLRLARAKLDGAGIDLRQGDISTLPLDDGCADTVILHQVLHYLPAPEAALAELGRIMARGGRLLIVDFASHDLEELRDRDAHARLGFSDEQISLWCASAGLSATLARTLVGARLTVKIWCARPVDAVLASPIMKVVSI